MSKIIKILPEKSDFLRRTTEIAKPPKNFWYIGKVPELRPTVAIIGARKPTEYGRYVTLKLAAQLAARGVTIVSGLALGHDALAARGALDGGGVAVAVLGHGLDIIHPKSNRNLADEIVARGGMLLSEFQPDFPIYKGNFLQRNRLVSALSDAVVVVEAAARSGTLNTAMHALEQGRELMAVPGNITSPLSVGCNRLIQQGALPVTSVDDVLERLGLGAIAENDGDLPLGNNKTEVHIIETINSGVQDGDQIIAQTKITAPEFNRAITMLEIAGIVRSLGANRWVLR
ncbi:MAG: DNA-processing protein DprA [Candidatus Nomurabacteria bacterium]|jgi:DNA processing protein|nr:DNA-processing protein DprA [Candidatus Nomurabacteria bacterium]